jgi:hypothetical protein
MDEPANPFGSLTREGRLAATLTDLGGKMFDERGTTINREHLAHKFISRGCVAADVAVKHGLENAKTRRSAIPVCARGRDG